MEKFSNEVVLNANVSNQLQIVLQKVYNLKPVLMVGYTWFFKSSIQSENKFTHVEKTYSIIYEKDIEVTYKYALKVEYHVDDETAKIYENGVQKKLEDATIIYIIKELKNRLQQSPKA